LFGSTQPVLTGTTVKRMEEPSSHQKIDPRKSRVVELRFFGGLSVEETAEVLDVSPQTVMRDWKLAKAWLYQELKSEVRDED
jgi:RNA polymerase sigma factor (sigma-70 family)